MESADGEAVRGVATETGVHLCWPNRGQTKRRVGRTVRFVLHNNFVMGIKYNSLADLDGQTEKGDPVDDEFCTWSEL